MKLFEDGIKVSEIANRVGVSRQSVYNVIRDDFKKDPELIALEKELKKAELKKQIEEVKKPVKTKERLDHMVKVFNKVFNNFATLVYTLWSEHPELKGVEYCIYCGGKLEYVPWKNISALKCTGCKKAFPILFPYKKE